MDLNLINEIDEILSSEIGDDAILTTSSPEEVKQIRVVFHKEFSVETDMETQWEAYQVFAECKSADVIFAQQDDTITINSKTYKIKYIELTESGWTILRLSE